MGSNLGLAPQEPLQEGMQTHPPELCWAFACSLGEGKAAAEAARAGPQQVSPTGTRTEPLTGWEQLLETQ